MLKRITAVLTVLFVLFCAAHTFADDWTTTHGLTMNLKTRALKKQRKRISALSAVMIYRHLRSVISGSR